MPDKIVVYPSKLKMFGLMAATIPLAGVSLLVMLSRNLSIFEKFFGFVGVSFFGAGGIYALVRLIIKKPSLIVSDQDLTFQAGLLGTIILPWQDIEKVFPYGAVGQTTICVLPKDLAAFESKHNPITRRLMATGVKITGAPIGIAANTLSIPAEQTISIMQNHINNARSKAVSIQSEIPVLKRWNWGAFLLTWIWGIGNRVWHGFWVFVPFGQVVAPFILGMRGNKWAWKAKKWQSVEEFERVQKKWAIAGFIFLGAVILISGVALIVFLTSK